MDQSVVGIFRGAGMDTALADAEIAVQVDEQKQLQPPPATLCVKMGGHAVDVTLAPISKLFAGSKVPPSFSDGPPESYKNFYRLVEKTVVRCCQMTGQIERDVELERLYRQLRRRPDGKDANPIFAWAQAACRLYMSLNATSQAEFEAIVDRLSIVARHFSSGSTSRNYYQAAISGGQPGGHVHGPGCHH
jgi:hypothetical protein